MAAETVTPNAPATSGKFILDRPHLNPLPEERTSPATLLFRPAIVRPIPPQTFPKTREQFLLLLGEKAGMREDSKIISQRQHQFSPWQKVFSWRLKLQLQTPRRQARFFRHALDCGDTSPLSTTRHVASFQSADMSAHSKSPPPPFRPEGTTGN